MANEEQLYISIGKKLKAEESQMFGKPCLKVNGKAFCCFFQNEMVFKLTDKAHKEAMALVGAHAFDPSGKRPMKEWVQVPAKHSVHWEQLAKAAFEYVKENTK